jgi:hypothetical protein
VEEGEEEELEEGEVVVVEEKVVVMRGRSREEDAILVHIPYEKNIDASRTRRAYIDLNNETTQIQTHTFHVKNTYTCIKIQTRCTSSLQHVSGFGFGAQGSGFST